MSGSGTSGYSGGFSGGPSGDCESLVEDTQLSSPKEEVVRRLVINDVLSISLLNVDGRSIVIAMKDGDIAGGLTSPRVQRIRECILGGTEFEAIVRSIDDGQVKVRVKAVGK